MKSFNKLWEEFRSENPNTIGGFHEQYESFRWLYNKFTKRKVYTQKDLVNLVRFLVMNEEINKSLMGYSSITKESASYFVKEFLKEIENG